VACVSVVSDTGAGSVAAASVASAAGSAAGACSVTGATSAGAGSAPPEQAIIALRNKNIIHISLNLFCYICAINASSTIGIGLACAGKQKHKYKTKHILSPK
jgi:hypothetical protein